MSIFSETLTGSVNNQQNKVFINYDATSSGSGFEISSSLTTLTQDYH